MGMRYLKHINESLEDYTAKWDFEQDIRDILLEAEDLGYEVTERIFSDRYNYNYVLIRNYLSDNVFDKIEPINFKELKDCLLRLKDYLGDKYIGCQMIFGLAMDGDWRDIELTEKDDPMRASEATVVCINYK